MIEWRKTRAAVLKRDGRKCVECGNAVEGSDAHVHHKLPRALGGSDDADNLITLCSTCHSRLHITLHASLGRRFLETVGIKIAQWFAGEESNPDAMKRIGLAMRYLRIKKLRSGQLQPILSALSGRNVLLISATGSGKSLCFQIPALVTNGCAVVISPLRALMADQVAGLIRRQVPATFINSDISREEKKSRLDLVVRQKIKLLYLAPERFEESPSRVQEMNALKNSNPSYFVVDEAHCIDRWGDNFRPSYNNLSNARRFLGSPTVLAFTATAGMKTRNQIIESLQIQGADVFIEDIERPNIALLRLQMTDEKKRAEIIASYYRRMRSVCRGRALIFVPTRKVGDRVRELLKAEGLDIGFYHAKLDRVERDFLQASFDGRVAAQNGEDGNMLICTNAFGMGVDVPDIRLVFHWHHPASIEDYVQEFGRAGRDGKQSLAIVFTNPNDRKLLEWMARRTLSNQDNVSTEDNPAFLRKIESIAAVSELVNDKGSCAVAAVNAEFLPSVREKFSISNFILKALFAASERKKKREYCCDHCWSKRQRTGRIKLSDFGSEVIGKMEP